MSQEIYQYSDLIQIFNRLFRDSYNTILVKGGEEPIYEPVGETGNYHQVVFARGYFSSALHEISHWCIAGPERRLQQDYGYWYAPDGRSQQQQKEFEQMEVKPQALEWIFSKAAQHPFHMSIDNLGGEAFNRPIFARRIHAQVLAYLEKGLPLRAQCFASALVDFYQGVIEPESFDLEQLF